MTLSSQRGLLGVGFNSHVQVWKDALVSKAKDPYMRHELPGRLVDSVRFRPFEDVLGIGHAEGVSTMVRSRMLLRWSNYSLSKV